MIVGDWFATALVQFEGWDLLSLVGMATARDA